MFFLQVLHKDGTPFCGTTAQRICRLKTLRGVLNRLDASLWPQLFQGHTVNIYKIKGERFYDDDARELVHSLSL